MVGITLDQELNSYIRSMHHEGVLDENFDHLRGFQTEANPRFIADLLNIIIQSAQNSIAQITTNGPVIDLAKVGTIADQLQRCTGGIGGGRMAFACGELHQACEHGDEARSLQLFERVKQEHNTLNNCLNNIVQLELRILSNKTRRSRP